MQIDSNSAESLESIYSVMRHFAHHKASKTAIFAPVTHFGTHMDAPGHYVADGTPVDRLRPNVLIGPYRVVVYNGKEHIPAGFVQELDPEGVDRMLIKTSNSITLGRPEFNL